MAAPGSARKKLSREHLHDLLKRRLPGGNGMERRGDCQLYIRKYRNEFMLVSR